MSSTSSIAQQFKFLVSLLLKVYGPAIAVLLVLVVINLITHIRISVFTRDPIQIMQAPIYYGIVSNIGVLFWCATASICLFTACIASSLKKDREIVSFLRFSGLMTLFLLCDDLFLFHEELFPIYLHIPDKVLYAAYGAIVLIYVVTFRTMILSTYYLLFILSCLFFAISLAIDIPDIPFYGQHLIEDGCKWLGIVSWATYFISLCVHYLRRELDTAPVEVSTERVTGAQNQ